jgi:hypothetical protein
MGHLLHVDNCQRCRLTHKRIAVAMRAWNHHRHFEATLHLYAASDYLASRAGCMRAVELITDTAAHFRIELDTRQPPLFPHYHLKAKV